MEEDDDRKRLRQAAVFVTIPFVLAIPPVIGWFIGEWLDKKWGTGPILVVIFILLGFAAGIREFLRILKRFGDGY
jgi:ATP synthase protein I